MFMKVVCRPGAMRILAMDVAIIGNAQLVVSSIGWPVWDWEDGLEVLVSALSRGADSLYTDTF
jgi:hypothetical protein